jgi:nucleoside-diphosphate-sugar epimerase
LRERGVKQEIIMSNAVTTRGKVTILGINGHIGHWAARAFLDAGWQVSGFGRSNRKPLPGLRFIKGDADSLADMAGAVGEADVVVNALNLPYAEWDKGRLEAQTERVIAAIGKTGKTLLYPGNIYNYAAGDLTIRPDTPQNPETPRGEIRVRCETLLQAAAARGDIQLIILRAGDFFGPDNGQDWYSFMLASAGKGKVSVPGAHQIGHAWAYLPDLGRAFEKLAWHRREFSARENFHFAGHFVTNGTLLAALRAASPTPLAETRFPWRMFTMVSFVMPLVREVLKMRYLWNNSMALEDARLAAILGPDFATPFDDAVATTAAPYFTGLKAAA